MQGVRLTMSELPIPQEWRAAIKEIAAALAAGNYGLEGLRNAALGQYVTAEDLAENVADYGCVLVYLPDETWDTSRYIEVGDWWEAIVDLFTKEEGRSDLALHLTIREEKDRCRFYVRSVHVP